MNRAADAKPLHQNITPRRPTATEQALADVHHASDWPAHAVPWWLGADTHAAVLRTLRDAEARRLLQSAKQ